MSGVNASQVLFDAASCIKRYTNVADILTEFYELRLRFYVKRKEYMEGMLSAESLKLANQARFICEKIDGRIAIGNLTLVFWLSYGGNNGVLVIYKFPACKSIAAPPRGHPWGCRHLDACSARAAMGPAGVALGAFVE